MGRRCQRWRILVAVAFEEVKVTQEMESGQWPCGDLPEFSREFPEYRFQKICSKNVQVPLLTAPSAVVGVRGRGRGGCTESSVSAGCESSPPAIKSDRLSCGLSWVTPDGLGSLGTCGLEPQAGVHWCGQEDQLCQSGRTDVAHLVTM